MASPVQAPPPMQPIQPPRQKRSVAGPVVLILLGVVLLLTTMRVLQPQPLLHWFGTYWPALIILWGVIKLVEYQQAQREGTRPQGIGGGGVVLLVFLIVFGMSAMVRTLDSLIPRRSCRRTRLDSIRTTTWAPRVCATRTTSAIASSGMSNVWIRSRSSGPSRQE